jgi:hypothetical protein
MHSASWLWGWLGAGALLLAGIAHAEVIRPLAPPGTSPWEPVQFPKIERHTQYEVVENDGGASSLRSLSECSASGLALALSDVDLEQTPRLRWRWRIHLGLAIENERVKPGDDFAARVYVLFAYDPSRHSWLMRALRRAAELLYRRKLPGESINYVWASRAQVGARWPNPFTDAARMVVLRSGSDREEAAEWQTETVDLRADGESLLGEPLPPVEAIAIMTDSDNTCASASAEFADFQLLGPSPLPRPASPLPASDGDPRHFRPGAAGRYTSRGGPSSGSARRLPCRNSSPTTSRSSRIGSSSTC